MILTKQWAKKLKKSDERVMFFLAGSINCAQCVGVVKVADVNAQILVLDGGIHISVSHIVSFFEVKDAEPVAEPIPLVTNPAGPNPDLN